MNTHACLTKRFIHKCPGLAFVYLSSSLPGRTDFLAALKMTHDVVVTLAPIFEGRWTTTLEKHSGRWVDDAMRR